RVCPASTVLGACVPWFLQLRPSKNQYATIIFTNLNSGEKPVKSWPALAPPDRAGRELTTDLKTAATAAGCALQKTFELSPTNRLAVITQLLKTNPDGILLWLDPASAGACAKLLRLGNYSGAVAGPLRLHTPEFVAAAGK